MAGLDVAPDLSQGDVIRASRTHEGAVLLRVSLPAPAHRVLVAGEAVPAGRVVLSVPQQAALSTLTLDSHPVRRRASERQRRTDH